MGDPRLPPGGPPQILVGSQACYRFGQFSVIEIHRKMADDDGVPTPFADFSDCFLKQVSFREGAVRPPREEEHVSFLVPRGCGARATLYQIHEKRSSPAFQAPVDKKDLELRALFGEEMDHRVIGPRACVREPHLDKTVPLEGTSSLSFQEGPVEVHMRSDFVKGPTRKRNASFLVAVYQLVGDSPGGPEPRRD